jgi:hypothetical protein
MSALLGLAQTLILFLPAPNGLYVAADSRYDGGDPARKDHARKVFLCGKRAVCAISGSLILHARTQDAGGTPRQGSFALGEFVETLSGAVPEAAADDQIAWINDRLHSALERFWKEHIGGRPLGRPLSSWLGAASVCTLLFVKQEPSGEVLLAQVQFPFREIRSQSGWLHELQKPVVRPADPERPLAQGATTCPRIDPSEPPPVETHERTVETLRRLFSQSRDGGYCEEVIGGPIDIAFIDRDGAAWIARK